MMLPNSGGGGTCSVMRRPLRGAPSKKITADAVRARTLEIAEMARQEAEKHLTGMAGSGEAADALRDFAAKLRAEAANPAS